MKATRKGFGKQFVVTAGSDIAAGDVVIAGNLHGVAPSDIQTGHVGIIEREGEYEIAYDGAANATQGAAAYWNATTGKVTTTSSNNTAIGYFALAAAAGDTVCRVVLA